MRKDPTIKILVATHKKYHMPMDDIYLPVQVGKALHPELTLEGYQPDDDGENISGKNPFFCELTALFWGWKNVDADYIGLAHYRRHFCQHASKWKFASVLSSEEAKALCAENDVILPKRRKYYIETLASHYKHTHDIEHLELTREIIRRRCPDYLDDFDKVMDRTWAHMFNMCIMKREIMDSYCSWLFAILFDLEKEIDTKNLSAFDARLYGRVSEFLLDIWLTHNHVRYKEIGYVQMGDENWPSKIKGFLNAKFRGKKYAQSR